MLNSVYALNFSFTPIKCSFFFVNNFFFVYINLSHVFIITIIKTVKIKLITKLKYTLQKIAFKTINNELEEHYNIVHRRKY